MEDFTVMKIKNIIALILVGIFFTCGGLFADFKVNKVFSLQFQSLSSQKSPYNKLAKRLNLPEEEISKLLTCQVLGKTVRLIPLEKCPETWELWKSLFVNANENYMKYYAEGKLRTEARARYDYNFRLDRLWKREKPHSLTFVIEVDGVLAGKTSVGSLVKFSESNLTEIDYVLLEKFSGHGITTKSVGLVIKFLKYLIAENKYKLNILRLTAKTSNIASQKVALKNGFKKSENIIINYGSPTFEFFLNLNNN